MLLSTRNLTAVGYTLSPPDATQGTAKDVYEANPD